MTSSTVDCYFMISGRNGDGNPKSGESSFFFYPEGTLKCITVNQTSDIRLKNRIKNVDNILDKISNIDPFYFT